MKELTILLVVLIVIFIYINFIRKSIHLDLVESTINNQKYYVRKLPDSQEASNKLARLSNDLLQLMNHIRGKDREGIDRLIDNFNTDIITPGFSLLYSYKLSKSGPDPNLPSKLVTLNPHRFIFFLGLYSDQSLSNCFNLDIIELL